MTSLVSKLKQHRELLDHILDLPELPAVVQSLDAGVLTRLIRHIGLEDSGEIISLATTEQLKGILDEDLWHSEAPGRDERFDVERFSLWLEIMLENGSAFAAQKVLELDEDLLILGLCRLVLVVGVHDAALESADDPMLNKVLDGSLNEEFGGYLVISRDDSSWDLVCDLMAELNESDYDTMIRLLYRCYRVSCEHIEDNGGLYHVLNADEMLEEDVTSERQERREGRGFVTPSSAAHFLSQARSGSMKEILAAETMDPVSHAYFKAADMEDEPAVKSGADERTAGQGDSKSIRLKVQGFVQTLQNAEVLPASDKRLLRAGGENSWDPGRPLARAMRSINRTDPDLYARRLKEFSYLSNTLIAGCGFKGRTFQPKEAAEAALSVCNLGSEYLYETDAETEADQPSDPLKALLKKHHLIKMFQVGWNILFHDVVLYTAEAVLDFIDRLKFEMKDPEQAHEIGRRMIMLRFHIASGRPWAFHDQMDFFQEFLDAETTMAISDMLQEYPTLAMVICRKEGRRLSPFIGSQEHIVAIQSFLREALGFRPGCHGADYSAEQGIIR